MKETFNISNLVRSNVAAMTPYSSARDEFKDFDQEMVFLDANENPYENGVNRYPDPQHLKLKELIGAQKGLSSDHILLGNGSDEVLDLLFRAFCNPGVDNIITLPPTYGMYKVLAATNDIENREVILNEEFQPNIDGILNAIDIHTKMIFLCSPNNPTGNLIDKSRIKKLLAQFDGLFIIDEAYIDFCKSESWVDEMPNYPNLVITQTLSKAFGLAGIRLGICYASEIIIEVLNKIKPPYNVNSLSQDKAFERISSLEKVDREVNNIIDNRDRLTKALNELPFVEEVFISEANFILSRVDDATKRYNQLLELGIVVRNRSTQPLCENTLRFTVGTSEENQKLINALNNLK